MKAKKMKGMKNRGSGSRTMKSAKASSGGKKKLGSSSAGPYRYAK